MKSSPRTEYPFRWRPDGSLADGPSADGSSADGNGDGHPPAPPGDEKLPEHRPGSVRKAAWLGALEWAILIVAALTVALLVKTFLFQAFYIPSESMIPTLEKHDRVLVNKLSYRFHDVHRGDIIVFTAPEDIDSDVKDLVKRVIGLPGERIEGRADGRVYVNGKRLEEEYLPKGVRTEPGFAEVRIPKDSYWVMGDNRENSKDSRFFPEHFVPKSDIVGRVFVRIWPPNRLHLL